MNLETNGVASKKFRGGAVPYGYSVVDGVLAPVHSEQDTIKRASELHGQGFSLRAIANTFEAERRVSRNGKPFAAQQITNILVAANGAESVTRKPTIRNNSAFCKGRRAGIEEAIAYLSARSQELLYVCNTTKLERRCDIYDIRHREAEHCIGLVKTLLEAK